jgi:DNA-binding NarL/FixJ family response regulator
MTDRSESPSILSRGERDVARRLRAGESVAEIADARETSTTSVEKAIDRVREKTERALSTLAESPFTTDLDPERKRTLQAALAADDAENPEDGSEGDEPSDADR